VLIVLGGTYPFGPVDRAVLIMAADGGYRTVDPAFRV
jgi:hypothetical protein